MFEAIGQCDPGVCRPVVRPDGSNYCLWCGISPIPPVPVTQDI